MDSYSSVQAAGFSGLPLTTVAHLAATGLVSPSLEVGRGRGSSRRYSFADLCALRVIERSRVIGASPSAVRPLLAHIQSLVFSPEDPPTGIFLVGRLEEGQLTVVERTADTVASSLSGSPVVLVVDIDATVRDTTAVTSRMGRAPVTNAPPSPVTGSPAPDGQGET